MKKILIVVFLLIVYTTWGAEINVGIASRVITPQLPFWMTGYGSRSRPATEVMHDIWAKALVFEENPGSRVVIVTTDLWAYPTKYRRPSPIAGKSMGSIVHNCY